MDIESVWVMICGEGIIIVIVDDGVDVMYLEFSSFGKVVVLCNMVWNVDIVNLLFFFDNYGMVCVGVVCVNGNDKVLGVVLEVKLLFIKIGGLGLFFEVKVFVWVVDYGVDVIFCSWGLLDGKWWNLVDVLYYIEVFILDSICLVIDYVMCEGCNGKGCVIVWVGGNGNENICFDGYVIYFKVIVVVVCNDRGKCSIYSDYGDVVWCSFLSSD